MYIAHARRTHMLTIWADGGAAALRAPHLRVKGTGGRVHISDMLLKRTYKQAARSITDRHGLISLHNRLPIQFLIKSIRRIVLGENNSQRWDQSESCAVEWKR